MKKYKLGYQPYLMTIICFFIFAFVFYTNVLGFFAYIICIPFIILQCVALIDVIFICCIIIDDNGISVRDLFENRYIEWNSIKLLDKHYGNFIYRNWVSVLANNKKIQIYSWYKNSKELIKLLVDECKKRDIKIDPMVEKIIEDKTK